MLLVFFFIIGFMFFLFVRVCVVIPKNFALNDPSMHYACCFYPSCVVDKWALLLSLKEVAEGD